MRTAIHILFCLALLWVPSSLFAQDKQKRDSVLIVRGGDDYPPFEFINDNGVPDGFNVDIFHALMKIMKVPYQFKLGKWDEVVEALDSNKVDMLIGMIYKEDRAKKYRFSIPLCTMNRSIFVRRDSPVKHLKDLKDKEIGVQAGGWSHRFLTNNALTPKIMPCESTGHALSALANGKYDAVLGSDMVCLAYLTENNITNIKVLPMGVKPQAYSMVVSARNDTLLNQINVALRQLKANGEYDRIYNKWFSIYEEQKAFDATLAWRIVGILALLSLVGIALTILFRVQVKKATKRLSEANKELRESKLKMQMGLTTNGYTQWEYHTQNECFRKIVSNDIHVSVSLTKEQFLSIIVEEDKPIVSDLFRRMNEHQEDNIKTEFRVRDNNEVKWHSVIIWPFERDEQGRIIAYTGLSMNNNYWHQVAEELTRLKEKAELSDQLKSTFLANMSHEIRTPLNAIVGFSSLLDEVEDPEEKAEYKRIIQSNNELLLQLINDILDLSKIESGYMKLKEQEIHLNEFFSDLYTTFAKRMPAQVELRIERPQENHTLLFDKDRLSQLLGNFLNNAIKFTTAGSITAGYAPTQGGMRFYVRDTGIGISEANQKKVFIRFEKLNEFAQGTGLGLSICAAIAEAKGGRVGVESKEGEGSTFWVWLPCTHQAPPQEEAK